MRELIALRCSTCRRKNYFTTKNKRKDQGKFEVKKFCKFCRSYTVHKEAKV